MRLRNFKSSLYCRKNDERRGVSAREKLFCAGGAAVRFYELDLYRYTQNHT